jgi:hypothetical protein
MPAPKPGSIGVGLQQYALSEVYRALSAGDLKRMPCEVCQARVADAHHDDYAQPLVVRWLCRSHHRQWHVEHGPGLNRDAVHPHSKQPRCSACGSLEHRKHRNSKACPKRKAA